MAGSDAGVEAWLPGLIALASGLLLVIRGRGERFRLIFGVAVAVWGAGRCWQGVGGQAFPGPGDVVCLVAAMIAIAAVLDLPRRTRGTHIGLRLVLDAMLLGVTVALPVWHFFFASALGEQRFGWLLGVAVVLLVIEVTLFVVTALAYLRDFDRHLLVVLLGVAAWEASDQMGLHRTLQTGGPPHWIATVCGCLLGPLIAVGALRHRGAAAPPDSAGPVDPDARAVAVTTTLGLVMLGLTIGSLALEPTVDVVALVLVVLAVVVLWARELATARFRAQLLRELHAEATTDPLTGLANRRVLAARMAELADGGPWCLLTVDLDGFKDVNDLLGHATGDLLLASVARQLTAAAPEGALVSRIGGDEFAVLLPGDIEAGVRVGGSVVTAVRKSAADIDGVARVEISASVGVAAVTGRVPALVVLPDTDAAAAIAAGAPDVTGTADVAGTPDVAGPPDVTLVDPLGALSASGAALRVAKAAGRNRVEIYDAGVARIRQRRLRVEERLRSAIETGAITVLYQPIVDLKRGQVSGAEALARWNDSELGWVDPGEFITVAEQTGQVVAIGERVLEETLGGAVAAGLFERGIRLSCNVSPVQLRVPGFHQVVQEAIASHGVPREQLVLEVTEQVLVEEGQAAQTLHRLAGLGIAIAIDDFGTGYSALGYLQRLPADILKIDRSLTSSLISEPRSRAITRAVVDMGRTVGLSVVVEGVESSQVDDLVRRMGVGYGQGLLYGAAMSATELAELADRLAAERSTNSPDRPQR
jgi:diguanylate cyclase (GGDEF)-like protein